MTDKKGFLLIELVTGIVLFSFFVLIVAEYTIKIKTTCYEALKKIEALSLARNILEEQKSNQKATYHSEKESEYIVTEKIIVNEKTKKKRDIKKWNNLIVSKDKKELASLIYIATEEEVHS